MITATDPEIMDVIVKLATLLGEDYIIDSSS